MFFSLLGSWVYFIIAVIVLVFITSLMLTRKIKKRTGKFHTTLPMTRCTLFILPLVQWANLNTSYHFSLCNPPGKPTTICRAGQCYFHLCFFISLPKWASQNKCEEHKHVKSFIRCLTSKYKKCWVTSFNYKNETEKDTLPQNAVSAFIFKDCR